MDELKAKGGNSAADAPADEKIADIIKEKDAEIDNMAAQVAWLHRKLDQTSEELDKANEQLAQAEELVAEIDKFEELKQRKDDEIASLKKKLEQSGGDSDEILDLKATNQELIDEIAKLKKQLEDNKGESQAPILDNLDDGIEFTDDDKNQMSLFK